MSSIFYKATRAVAWRIVMLDDEKKRDLAKLPKATLVNFVADVQGMDKLLDKKIERLLLQSDKPKLIKKLTSTLKGLRR